MAPRIRLTISKPLPTICEIQEEILDDSSSNTKGFGRFSVNSDAGSSDDYLQSICQLAKPTFPVFPDNPHEGQDRKVLKTRQRASWVPKLVVAKQAIPKCKLMAIFSDTTPLGKARPGLNQRKVACCPRADPLEQLYAREEETWHHVDSVNGESSITDHLQHSLVSPRDATRQDEIHLPTPQEKKTEQQDLAGVFGFPRIPSPRPMERENSCPELKCLTSHKVMAVSEMDQTHKENCTIFIDDKWLQPYPPRQKLQGKKVLSCSLQRQCAMLQTTGSTGKEELKSSYNRIVKGEVLKEQYYPQRFHIDKKAVIHSWVSERRSAWKGAKIKAGLLPAIAEI